MSRVRDVLILGTGAILGIGAAELRSNLQEENPAIEASVEQPDTSDALALPTTTVTSPAAETTTTVAAASRTYGNFITCYGEAKVVVVGAQDAFPANNPGTGSVLRAIDRTVYGSYPNRFSNIESADIAYDVARDVLTQGGVSIELIDTNEELDNIPFGTSFEMPGTCL